MKSIKDLTFTDDFMFGEILFAIASSTEKVLSAKSAAFAWQNRQLL